MKKLLSSVVGLALATLVSNAANFGGQAGGQGSIKPLPGLTAADLVVISNIVISLSSSPTGGVALTAFDATQFSTNGGKVVIPAGAKVTNIVLNNLSSNTIMVLGPGGILTTGIVGANLSYDAATRTLSSTASGSGGGLTNANSILTPLVNSATNATKTVSSDGSLTITDQTTNVLFGIGSTITTNEFTTNTFITSASGGVDNAAGFGAPITNGFGFILSPSSVKVTQLGVYMATLSANVVVILKNAACERITNVTVTASSANSFNWSAVLNPAITLDAGVRYEIEADTGSGYRSGATVVTSSAGGVTGGSYGTPFDNCQYYPGATPYGLCNFRYITSPTNAAMLNVAGNTKAKSFTLSDNSVAGSNSFLVVSPGGIMTTGIIGSNLSYDAATRTLSSTASGSATNTLVDRAGGSALAVGDSTITLSQTAFFNTSRAGYLVIDAFTTNCELRRIASVSGTTIGFNTPLAYTHPASAKILYASGDAQAAWWNPVGTASASVDDTMAIQRAVTESSMVQQGSVNVWLDGGGNTYSIKNSITALHDARIKRLNLKAVTGYATTGTNDWMLQFCQGERYVCVFSNSFVYIPTGWAAPTQGSTDPTNVPMAFYGTNLPPELVMGKTYYIRDVDTQKTNWFQIGVDTNSTLAFSTTTGTNFVYAEVHSLTRGFLEDVYLEGNNLAYNGLKANFQQPQLGWKVRVNNLHGMCFWFDGQEYLWTKIEAGNCDVGLFHGGLGGHVIDFNCESFTNGVIASGVNQKMDMFHFEGSLGSTSTVFDATGSRFSSIAPLNYDIGNGVIANGSSKQIVIDSGNSLGAASVHYKYIYLSGFNQDNGDIAIRDNFRARTIMAYISASNGMNRIFGEGIFVHVPDNTSIDDKWSGLLIPGMGGRYIHIGSQYGTHRFIHAQLGTNDTANWLELYANDSGTNKFVIDNNGNVVLTNGVSIVIAKNSTNGWVLTSTNGGFGYWAPATTSGGSSTFDTITVSNRINLGTNTYNWPSSASLDGTSDYLNRGADLTGNADGTNGTVSVWFRHAVSGIEQYIVGSSNFGQHFLVYIAADDKVTIDGYTNSPAGIGLRLKSATAYADTNWHHLMASWSIRDTAKRHLYVDNTQDLSAVVYNNTVLAYASGNWEVGARGDGQSKFNGCLFDPMLWLSTYTDLSSATTRSNFIAGGFAVDPGSTGTGPNGVQPIIYLRGWNGTNAGSGGFFTVNGTLSDSCTVAPPAFNAPFVILDTNGTTFTKVWSQGGYLFSGASSANQTIPVSDWTTISNGWLRLPTNVSVGANNTLTTSTNFGATFKSTIGGTAPVLRTLDTNGNTYFDIATNGLFGIIIGTNATGALVVSNNAGVSNTAFGIIGQAPSLYTSASGNVGIKTNAATAALEVQGHVSVSGGQTNSGPMKASSFNSLGGFISDASLTTSALTINAAGVGVTSESGTVLNIFGNGFNAMTALQLGKRDSNTSAIVMGNTPPTGYWRDGTKISNIVWGVGRLVVTNNYIPDTNSALVTVYKPLSSTVAFVIDPAGNTTITNAGLLIGPASATITNILTGSASLDFGSIAASTVSDLPITVTGVTSNNCHVALSVPWESASAGGSFSYFNSNDTVYVRFSNQQAVGAIDPGPGTFSVLAFKVK